MRTLHAKGARVKVYFEKNSERIGGDSKSSPSEKEQALDSDSVDSRACY
jgi:hypothetical protein